VIRQKKEEAAPAAGAQKEKAPAPKEKAGGKDKG
jgi:hypothetical protein